MRGQLGRRVSVWKQREEQGRLEKDALVQQLTSARDDLELFERDKKDVQVELDGVEHRLFECGTELDVMLWAVDWLAPRLVHCEDLLRRGWALLRASVGRIIG